MKLTLEEITAYGSMFALLRNHANQPIAMLAKSQIKRWRTEVVYIYVCMI